MLWTDEVTLAYREAERVVLAVDRVSVEVRQGEFVGIMGPSGSGKSSLLYLMSGLKLPTSGEVRFHNRVIHLMSERERMQLRRREFGFVFQQPYLLPYLTALENVLVAVPGDREAYGRALQLFEQLGLLHLANRYPHKLSGGERQRVCGEGNGASTADYLRGRTHRLVRPYQRTCSHSPAGGLPRKRGGGGGHARPRDAG